VPLPLIYSLIIPQCAECRYAPQLLPAFASREIIYSLVQVSYSVILKKTPVGTIQNPSSLFMSSIRAKQQIPSPGLFSLL